MLNKERQAETNVDSEQMPIVNSSSPNAAKPNVGCCTSMKELRINISESQLLSDATKAIVLAFINEQFEKEKQLILEAFENCVNCGVENQYAFSDLFAEKYFNKTFKN